MTRLPLLLIAMLLNAGQAAAEPLGRLFFSPQERAALDQGRASQAGGPAAPTDGQLNLSGYVKRSSGKSTAWINAVPQHDVGAASPAGNGVPVRLPSGRQVTLKPGQSYDPASGQIREGYQAAPSAAETRQP